jgi:peptidoglycan endopeptidase LytE
MVFTRLFPCVLSACFVLSLLVATATAQTIDNQPRQTAASMTGGINRLENEPVIISVAEAPRGPLVAPRSPQLNQLLIAAIDTRMGAPYIYGATGPYGFDCSGFVWSVYQSAGISFERGSARTLWSRFTPATKDEEKKFGTLVFFNGLSHVGIVADEHGFYHSSRSYGVIYSPFSDYWRSRIDGFRRVPLPTQQVAE